MELTQAQKDKVRECLLNRDWRLEHLYYIKDKDGRRVKFKLNHAQKRFMQDRHNASIILKARQQGFTTLSCILFLDACLFNPNISAGIIAHNLEDANSFFTDKIKFAYDNLPDDIRSFITANTERAGELRFNNGSSIRVRTSFRSGTLQYLHISEFGKICAKSPDKAKEIVTGALNAISKDQTVVIESTAEGKAGYFYEYCQRAQALQKTNGKLTEMDFKFNFFPWHESPEYRLNPEGVVIPERLGTYFKELEDIHGIKLDPAQKAWYFKKELTQGDDMMKEYPSYPDEAFAQAIEGAYYAKQFLWLEAQRPVRIGTVPWEPRLKVHTVWDLGWNDSTAIWFFQVGPAGERRYIDYLEDNEKTIPWYIGELRKRGYTYGKTILPHDVQVHSLETGKTRLDVFKENGIHDIEVIPQMDPMTRIEAARLMLPKCWFDLAKCSDGIEALKQYRKAWDDKAGCWKDKPLHDWTSHAADSFGMSAFVECQDIPRPTQTRAINRFR